ncbi:hypothetical protein GWI33_016013 [Rhynchophorus ferrugineus]|uniref:Lariat debranching enzyme C-terminal domain-containing protein n=1 Tax=Rhynchophorus ferrugineus TaxID=354439 RepID=A0A834M5D5_RHYFE|nr:hypothetical protein GWI33_016013 [Rhynchophorus ferrugineus]
MKIAVEGCAHGELERIYCTIQEIEQNEDIKIDLLICCGDFQSTRNEDDLCCMAVPPKYRRICSFYKYYNGEKIAPVLTIFIGGNHEASNYLQELPYGGWVAPNIFYLGYAGVINIAGIRIGGLSGIYKANDYLKGRFEKTPYTDSTIRSVYHIRNLDVFRLKQMSQPIDIFLSHDWPAGVYNYGNMEQLLKRKPFFKDDIESDKLGSKPCQDLLHYLKPQFWFSAHLHCKFAALVPHDDNTITKFLSLDKCLPRRHFLQIVNIDHNENEKIQINYDLEWLTILSLTNHLINIKNAITYMPGPGNLERYDFTPTEDEKTLIFQKLGESLKVPNNFKPTALGYNNTSKTNSKQPPAKLNPQTVELCNLIGLDDPLRLVSENSSDSASESKVESDISLQEKIKELKLPEPKHEINNVNMINTAESDGLKIETSIPIKLSPKRSLDGEVRENEEVTKPEVNNGNPSPKKFKRRNAQIYSTESHDS